MKFDIEGLKKVDRDTKPGGACEEWEYAWRLYNDCSRQDTSLRLQQIGAGLSQNPKPLEIQLMRRVIDRLAVIYAHPPTRWYERSEERLAEDSAEHKAITELLEKSRYNLALRHADRTRTNLRQALVRFYPSDALGCVLLRVFEPNIVLREPSPYCPDVIDEDVRFALKLAGTGSDKATERWEYWEQRAPGQWACNIIDGNGELAEGMQPYAGGINPYSALPVMMIYDGYPAGQAWLPPRFSRTAWNDSINAMANDLWALVLNEAHNQTVVSTDDTKLVPKSHGPGTVWVLPKDATASVLQKLTHMQEAQGILDNFVRLWSLSEDLPSQEFDRAPKMLTGASLKVASQPLLARREEQVEIACYDEEQAFEKYRAVHNYHAQFSKAPKWSGAYVIPEDIEIEAEIAEIEIPADKKEIQDTGAKQIMIGTASLIDQIMLEYGIPRHRAIKKYAQIVADMDEYPPRQDPAAGPATTTNPDGTLSPRSTTEEVYQTNSMAAGASQGPDAADTNAAS